jgi:hypothetical protein
MELSRFVRAVAGRTVSPHSPSPFFAQIPAPRYHLVQWWCGNEEMTVREPLQVRVNDDLVLDAGTYEERPEPARPGAIHPPPSSTLFHQVLAYLRAKPDPPNRASGSMGGREGVAAAVLVLRWGSYLAVLLDRHKPVWPVVRSASTSRISDEEMARINIEASAALAEWIDLYRADPISVPVAGDRYIATDSAKRKG